MSFTAETQAIESRFATNWGSTTPIKYDNVEYTPTPGTTFVELQIHTGMAAQVSIGNPSLHRHTGIISINIYTALNMGSQTAKTLADTAAAIFRNQQFSSVVCRSASITRLGEIDGWFVYNVSVPYFRDEAFSY